jgi:hypothetical protein
MGIVIDGTSSVTDSKNGTVSLLYKHTHELGPQIELIQCHCIIHKQNLTGKALGFEHTINALQCS